VIVTSVVKVTDFNPSILRNIISFALLRGFIGVLGADSINVVFGLILKLAMQVSQLMARSWVLHWCTRNHFICLFINHIGLCGIDAFDFIFTLLTTYDENLVLCLDGRELLGKSVCVAQLDALCGLTGKFMNIKFLSFFIEIVKTRAAWC
jgi:hypothetical protein